jgi:quercetin dioxygenase-like cupin family protein
VAIVRFIFGENLMMLPKTFAGLALVGLTLLQHTAVSQSPTNSSATSALEILRAHTQTRSRGPAENFTGTVHIESRFVRAEPSRLGGARVSFDPGARTAWHTHPLGQTLVVTEGIGWVQIQGGVKLEIRPGDVIWTPPGVKHWHGATTEHAMTHVAIAEALQGSQVQWMEHVSEAEYRR